MLWKDAPQSLAAGENFFRTPIFIQNFNQVSYLRKLVNWLLAAGYKNICVIDNHSSYSPLLQFYSQIESRHGIKVLRRSENGSRTTLWEDRLLDRFGVTGPFVYTDSDIVPDEICPIDIVGRLASYLREYPQILKAGLGLRIDDLPEHYRFASEVAAWERQFWTAPVCRGAFLGLIDTTFALYRASSEFARGPALRTGWPYVARHETWYQNSNDLPEEDRYYLSEIEKTSRSHWARRRLPERLETAIAERNGTDLKLLHLACGHNIIPGWINLDRNGAVGAVIIFDLETCARNALPLEPNSIDGFYMCDAFPEIKAVMPMMQELYRVAKADARLIIRQQHPGVSNEVSPDFAQWWSSFPSSFVRYGEPWLAGKPDVCAADWSVKRLKLVVDKDLPESERNSRIFELLSEQRIICKEVVVELRAVKPARPKQSRPQEFPVPEISGTDFDAESDFQMRP